MHMKTTMPIHVQTTRHKPYTNIHTDSRSGTKVTHTRAVSWKQKATPHNGFLKLLCRSGTSHGASSLHFSHQGSPTVVSGYAGTTCSLPVAPFVGITGSMQRNLVSRPREVPSTSQHRLDRAGQLGALSSTRTGDVALLEGTNNSST